MKRYGPSINGKRFIRNLNKLEVHDLDNEKTGPNQFQINEIIRAGKVVTSSPDALSEAHRRGYGICAHYIARSER